MGDPHLLPERGVYFSDTPRGGGSTSGSLEVSKKAADRRDRRRSRGVSWEFK
jgi:hypothetical protein